MSITTSEALVEVSELILSKIGGLSTTEMSKRGRKYRFVNNNFQRVREEKKHLVINPERLLDHISTVLAYSILSSILPDIFTEHTDLCLIIVGVARAMEEKHWFEEENSSVMHVSALRVAFTENQTKAAMKFVENVTPQHLAQGYNLLYCSKLNFLHTDHHVGAKLEGECLRKYVKDYFGEEALELAVVLSALKSFSHWANIKGLLYKLGLPNMDVDDELRSKFDTFPDPPAELVQHVHERFPSGASKYSLLCKALDHLASYKYAQLISYPEGPLFDARWLYDLYDEISRDPARFHLRSKAKKLSPNPANLQELSQRYRDNLDSLSLMISLILHAFPDTARDFLAQSTRIPPFTDELAAKYLDYYAQLVTVANEVNEYEAKGWTVNDIVLRMHKAHIVNLRDEIQRVAET